MPHERIQKTLAAAGFGSRRHCEQLVLDGRVTVNGKTLSALPALVDPAADRITVDGRPVRAEPLVYFMLNKPPGVLCTNEDPAGRTRACDLLRGVRERVFPVGRLDVDSMGLLILTNDGPLAQRLTHPRYGVPKTYRAEIAGAPSDGDLARLRAGVWLSEGKTAPAQVAVIHRQRNKSILEITLREGRNREVRRMLAKLGHNVRRLVRIQVGKLSIRKLGLGAFRKLTPDEIKYLRGLADNVPERATQPVSRSRRPSHAPGQRRSGARPTGRRNAAARRSAR
jgi:23S rRNA pseudouridine2605 synthase